MSTIEELEHELGIAGHEHDCPRCQGLKRVEAGRCHWQVGEDVIRLFECPHDDL